MCMPFVDSGQESAVLVLTEEEEKLVGGIANWLKENNSDDYELVQGRFLRLKNLGIAVSGYPSIRNTEFLKGVLRNEDRLVESLVCFSPQSHLLHIPTKVVALRSFLVAKFHAFSLLSYLTGGNDDFNVPVKRVVFSVICTLMAEDVYFSCLEDPAFSDDIKIKLADDLVALWDKGIDPRGIRHLSALSSLWIARDRAPPCFGTMDGNAELMRICIGMENDWYEFLIKESGNDETIWALEEFLFGLSYEDIREIRCKLEQDGISAISYDEIHSYLGSKPLCSEIKGSDHRAFYDFFIERRDACTFRKKTKSPGPLRTLEEIYLKYRIILEADESAT